MPYETTFSDYKWRNPLKLWLLPVNKFDLCNKNKVQGVNGPLNEHIYTKV